MSGARVPLFFCVFLFYSLEFTQGSIQPYHLSLTSHVPPGSEGLLDRRLTKPCTWMWGILHSRPSYLKTD